MPIKSAWDAFQRWLVAEPAVPLEKPVSIRAKGDGFRCRSWGMDTPIFRIPTGDDWTVQDACQGVLILGTNGSGKSSGSADLLALKMLRLGAGGLVLCVKVGEADYWQDIARLAGRENDLIRMTEKDHAFNVFNYELRRTGRGAGLTMNLMHLFRHLLDLAEDGGARKPGADFWERAASRCIANAIQLQAALEEPFSMEGVREIISSCPRTSKQAQSSEWLEESTCGQACTYAMEHQEDDYDAMKAVDYFTVDLPAMGDKQRAGITETWEGLADPLLRSPMRQKFSGATTWTPEDAISRGRIIVIDLPVKEFGAAGRMAGVIAKFMFQKAIERRPPAEETSRRPCFIWADEFQHFFTSYDPVFQQTARSSKTCTVYIAQNIPSILSAIGGDQGRPFMNNLLGNLNTQIFHANAESDTNRHAADTIGKEWQFRKSVSAGESQQRLAPAFSGSTNANASLSEHLEHIILPLEFSRLRTGSERNDYIVDAIFFQAARTFRDGYNVSRVFFRQRPLV